MANNEPDTIGGIGEENTLLCCATSCDWVVASALAAMILLYPAASIGSSNIVDCTRVRGNLSKSN